MLLVVDIGNTNITLGLFDREEFAGEYRIESDINLSCGEYGELLKSKLKNYVIEGCIVSSVVDELNDKFCRALKEVFEIEPIFLTTVTNSGVMIVSDAPEEVGADRIANAAAVVSEYGAKAVIVVDFGTATTFDIVNSRKELCGGVIFPGVRTQIKSLCSSTSKLPEIEIKTSPCAVGHNTSEAILSGVIRGSACLVDGLVAQCEKELGEKVILVATGGYCELVAKYMKRSFDKVDKILTLKGLKEIYKLNSM